MRAAKICPRPDCNHVQPCPDHLVKAWSTSKRSEHVTLSGSKQQKRSRFVINRDDTICHVCGHPGSDEADHVVPLAEGGADSVDNMAAVHSAPCHREKTAREARAARCPEVP